MSAIPVREAAERLGVSRQAIHQMVARGQLELHHIGPISGRIRARRAHWISVASIEKVEQLFAESWPDPNI